MHTETARTFPILARAIAGKLMDDPAANPEAETILKRFAADLEIADPARILGTSFLADVTPEEAADESETEDESEDGAPIKRSLECKLDSGPSPDALLRAHQAGTLRTSQTLRRSAGKVVHAGRVIGITTQRGLWRVGDHLRAPKVAAPPHSPHWHERDPLAWAEWVHCSGDSKAFNPAVSSIPVLSLSEAAERVRHVRKGMSRRQFDALVMAAAGATLREIGEHEGFRYAPADSAATTLLRCAIEAATDAYREWDDREQTRTYN